MVEQQQTSGVETAGAAEEKRLARAVEKDALIREITIFQSRKDAFEDLITDRKGRLEALMAADGERERTTADGDASFSNRRVVTVLNEVEVAKRFTKAVLAEHFKPGVAFIDACKETGISTEGALAVGETPTFVVSRAKTKKAKEIQKQIIEETKVQAVARVAAIVKSLKTKNQKED